MIAYPRVNLRMTECNIKYPGKLLQLVNSQKFNCEPFALYEYGSN